MHVRFRSSAWRVSSGNRWGFCLMARQAAHWQPYWGSSGAAFTPHPQEKRPRRSMLRRGQPSLRRPYYRSPLPRAAQPLDVEKCAAWPRVDASLAVRCWDANRQRDVEKKPRAPLQSARSRPGRHAPGPAPRERMSPKRLRQSSHHVGRPLPEECCQNGGQPNG
jgi:hypothetical protein